MNAPLPRTDPHQDNTQSAPQKAPQRGPVGCAGSRRQMARRMLRSKAASGYQAQAQQLSVAAEPTAPVVPVSVEPVIAARRDVVLQPLAPMAASPGIVPVQAPDPVLDAPAPKRSITDVPVVEHAPLAPVQSTWQPPAPASPQAVEGFGLPSVGSLIAVADTAIADRAGIVRATSEQQTAVAGPARHENEPDIEQRATQKLTAGLAPLAAAGVAAVGARTGRALGDMAGMGGRLAQRAKAVVDPQDAERLQARADGSLNGLQAEAGARQATLAGLTDRLQARSAEHSQAHSQRLSATGQTLHSSLQGEKEDGAHGLRSLATDERRGLGRLAARGDEPQHVVEDEPTVSEDAPAAESSDAPAPAPVAPTVAAVAPLASVAMRAVAPRTPVTPLSPPRIALPSLAEALQKPEVPQLEPVVEETPDVAPEGDPAAKDDSAVCDQCGAEAGPDPLGLGDVLTTAKRVTQPVAPELATVLTRFLQREDAVGDAVEQAADGAREVVAEAGCQAGCQAEQTASQLTADAARRGGAVGRSTGAAGGRAGRGGAAARQALLARGAQTAAQLKGKGRASAQQVKGQAVAGKLTVEQTVEKLRGKLVQSQETERAKLDTTRETATTKLETTLTTERERMVEQAKTKSQAVTDKLTQRLQEIDRLIGIKKTSLETAAKAHAQTLTAKNATEQTSVRNEAKAHGARVKAAAKTEAASVIATGNMEAAKARQTARLESGKAAPTGEAKARRMLSAAQARAATMTDGPEKTAVLNQGAARAANARAMAKSRAAGIKAKGEATAKAAIDKAKATADKLNKDAAAKDVALQTKAEGACKSLDKTLETSIAKLNKKTADAVAALQTERKTMLKEAQAQKKTALDAIAKEQKDGVAAIHKRKEQLLKEIVDEYETSLQLLEERTRTALDELESGKARSVADLTKMVDDTLAEVSKQVDESTARVTARVDAACAEVEAEVTRRTAVMKQKSDAAITAIDQAAAKASKQINTQARLAKKALAEEAIALGKGIAEQAKKARLQIRTEADKAIADAKLAGAAVRKVIKTDVATGQKKMTRMSDELAEDIEMKTLRDAVDQANALAGKGPKGAVDVLAVISSLPDDLRRDAMRSMPQKDFAKMFSNMPADRMADLQTLTDDCGDADRRNLVRKDKRSWSRRVEKNFPKWDLNGDGKITPDEIKVLMKDPSIKKSDAAALVTLDKHVAKAGQLHDDDPKAKDKGLSAGDLNEYRRRQADNGLYDLDRVEGDHRRKGYKIGRQNRDLFQKDPSDPSKTLPPDYKSVKQGGLGDCYFIAPLAALAKQDPQKVKDMITENKDGTYTVTFPSGDVMTVDAPTDSQVAKYGTSGKDGLWFPVMEKAYVQLRKKQAIDAEQKEQDELPPGKLKSIGPVIDKTLYNVDPESQIDYGDISGGHAAGPIDVLTGDGARTEKMENTTADQTGKALEQSLSTGKVVVAAIAGKVTDNQKKSGLPTGHAYSVVGYDPATKTVTLRNPWGHGEGTYKDKKNDGEFKMSLEDFQKIMTRVTYQK